MRTYTQIVEKLQQSEDRNDEFMQKLLNETATLKITKLEIEKYELDHKKFELRLDGFDKFHRENHVHYIQVENYLEKYLPMKIQKSIGKNIKAIFEERKGVVEKYL